MEDRVRGSLDPYVALWSMCNSLAVDRLPDRRVVVRFEFVRAGTGGASASMRAA